MSKHDSGYPHSGGHPASNFLRERWFIPPTDVRRRLTLNEMLLTASVWMTEESGEAVSACWRKDYAGVLDAVFDCLGIIICLLCALDVDDVVEAHTAYVRAQTDRDRNVDVIHHHLIQCLLVPLRMMSGGRRAEARAVLVARASRFWDLELR